jgi:hypothetical protein
VGAMDLRQAGAARQPDPLQIGVDIEHPSDATAPGWGGRDFRPGRRLKRRGRR